MHATHLLYALSIVLIEAKQNCNSNSQLAISIVIIEVRIHICVCYWTVYKLQQLVGKLERKAVHVNQASCGQKRNVSTTSFQVLSLSKTFKFRDMVRTISAGPKIIYLSAPATTGGVHHYSYGSRRKKNHVHNSQSRPLFMCKKIIAFVSIQICKSFVLLATAHCISKIIAESPTIC